MKVCRYSNSGFKPHYQDHLEKEVMYLIAQDFSQIPSHLVPYLEESAREVNPNWKGHLSGFWVFVGNKEDQDPEQVRHQLNHLKNPKSFEWFEKELANDTLCYPSHSVLKGSPKMLREFAKGDAIYVIASND